MPFIDLTTGIRPITQTPLNPKEHFQTLQEIQDLSGTESSDFYTFYEGMIAYVANNEYAYIWRERKVSETGISVMAQDYTYPSTPIVDGIDYSGRSFNFFVYSVKSFVDLHDVLDSTYYGKEGYAPIVTANPLLEGDYYLQLKKALTLADIYRANAPIDFGVSWVSGFVYDVFCSKYIINQLDYNLFASKRITLTNGDVTFNRIDLIILRLDLNLSNPIITVREGDPSGDPVEPTIDLTREVILSRRTVLANAVVDPTATIDLVFDENIEWTGTSSAGINFNDVSIAPFTGTKSVNIPETLANTFPRTIFWDRGSLTTYVRENNFIFSIINNVTSFRDTVFEFKLTNSVSGANFIKTVSLFEMQSYGFLIQSTDWHVINIPLSLFVVDNSGETQYDGISISFTNNNDINIDRVNIQGGVPVVTSPDIFVKEVLPGSGISIDSTDPERPIVSVIEPLERKTNDSFTGDRLKPVKTDLHGFMVEKDTNGYVGYDVANGNEGASAIAGFKARLSSPELYATPYIGMFVFSKTNAQANLREKTTVQSYGDRFDTVGQNGDYKILIGNSLGDLNIFNEAFQVQGVTGTITADMMTTAVLNAASGKELTTVEWILSKLLPMTFSNQIICNQANIATTLGATIDSTKEYFLDGVIDLGAVSIEVPAGGMNIKGYDFNISGLTSSEAAYTMFTSPIGGSGDILWKDFKIEVTGAGSQVLDIVSDTGNEAFEIDRINFNNCTSLGEIDNYRQGLETGTGRFGGTPNLILSGVWSGGFFIDASIVRGLTDGAYALYEAGTGFTMASRFRSNQNVDLNATVALLDFAPANFTNPSTLQLDKCLVTRNGVINAGDATLIPNISQTNLESIWQGNVGIQNTFVGGSLSLTVEVESVITTPGVFVDLLGTFVDSDLQHFDVPLNGQLRHLGNSPREFKVIFEGILVSTSGDELDLKVVVWDDSASGFVDYKITRRVVNNLQGGRDVAFYTIITNIILDKNDYVKLQVANVAATNNITAELNSDITVEER